MLDSFLVLPFVEAQKLAFALNAGIVAHAASHRVFSSRVYGGGAVPEGFLRWTVGGPPPRRSVLPGGRVLQWLLHEWHVP